MRHLVTGAAIAIIATLCAAPSAAQNKAGTLNQPRPRTPKIAGQPNFNGIWQSINTANWNLEDHSASALKGFWQLGSIGAIPAGLSVVKGGKIPYLPEAVAQREANQAGWPKADPETLCYLPGIPRATYMPYPFQIVQGGGNILFIYEYASANRVVYMSDHQDPPVDTWMGWSNGDWDGDTLVITTTGFNDKTWLDRSGNYHSADMIVTERLSPIDQDHIQYEATIEDPTVFSEPWTIQMVLYRNVDPNAEILEFKCVPFVEELLYKDLER